LGKRIMVVDDSFFARKMLREILTKHGYEVIGEAKNGEEAVTYFQELNPDLVTMDICMPNLSGIEALDQILELKPETKIIIVSSTNSKEIVRRTFQGGAFDFVVKPYCVDRLLQSVEKALIQNDHTLDPPGDS